jgi:hypothetical protein
MGLKCRLLGHQYGDPEIEREREENGDEVVATIREIQVCQRCGTEHVVSENKEVTSIRRPEEVGLETDAAPEAADPVAADEAPAGPETTPTGDASAQAGDAATPTDGDPTPAADTGTHIAEAEPDESAAPAPREDAAEASADSDSDSDSAFNDDDFEPPESPDEDDAVILDDEGDERDETQWPEDTGPDPAMAARESAAAEDGQPVEPETPDEDVTDDAEFIDAEEDPVNDDVDVDRERGEWPEREDVEDREPSWPVQEGEDEGFAAEPSDGSPSEDVSFGGLTPEANGHVGDDAAEEDYITAGDDGFTRAEQQGELQSDVPDDRIEFYCPNCGHARSAGASSMRAGDICPECKQGYIAERQL